MLTLNNICKDYVSGDLKVPALRGVDISFRKNEFVAILGPSGCGKTTLLNIIGGLDRYTQGDLIIKGRSTREYSDRDWDSYRNHSVGFVFQSYNLIPHQTVLSNVELALTLSGIGPRERRERAVRALERVGLGDQLRKKPGQMSGGQMQRVAIARALVNDPEIVLADEPTGALDSETSLQIMDALREIARDRLVIMVTHNPDLADQYATRIVRLLDGRIISDSRPCTGEEDGEDSPEAGRTGMSFGTALRLSLNNLMTKKGRTVLTAFAGSIGIIGIALILSLSAGVNNYIERVQRDTLSSYPLEIESVTVDMTDMISGMMGLSTEEREHEDGKVYSGDRITKMMSAWMSGITENDLSGLKKYLENEGSGIQQYLTGIQYEYETPLTLYRINEAGEAMQVNPSTVLDASGMGMMLSAASSAGGMQQSMMDSSMRQMNVFQALLDNPELLASQYTVLAGRMPQAMDEMVIIVNSRNELSDYVLYTLGFKDQGILKEQFEELMRGNPIESEEMEFTYDELLGLRFRLLVNTDYYEKQGVAWVDRRADADYLNEKLKDALEIKVVGILRPAEGAVTTSVSGAVGYRKELMEYLLEQVRESRIVQEQLSDPGIDVFTGAVFEAEKVDLLAELDNMSASEFFETYSGALGMNTEIQERIAQIPSFALNMISKDDIRQLLQAALPEVRGGSFEKNLRDMGLSDVDSPSAIYIYPKNFEAKERITQIIADYNASQDDEDQIRYTDYVGLLMSSVTNIINAISYVLIAFVSVSLVVSSIMIGIITYISVLERTKEIGILRALGASKRDISRVFTAETLIIGLVAGALGILITWLLTFPINAVIHALTDVNAAAVLPVRGALILVVISMLLTVAAGVIPSVMAARKDPVVALRTE